MITKAQATMQDVATILHGQGIEDVERLVNMSMLRVHELSLDKELKAEIWTRTLNLINKCKAIIGPFGLLFPWATRPARRRIQLRFGERAAMALLRHGELITSQDADAIMQLFLKELQLIVDLEWEREQVRRKAAKGSQAALDLKVNESLSHY